MILNLNLSLFNFYENINGMYLALFFSNQVKNKLEASDEINLFIVDDDPHYGESLKRAFENEFDERVKVKFFTHGESCAEEIKKSEKNNFLIVLDYFGIKEPEIKDYKNTIEEISKINSKKGIIILSLKKYVEKSIRCPVHNTFDYLPADDFYFTQMVNSVKKCLNIPRV